MNRWQALVEIVKSFNERGATTIAFAALCVFVIAPILILLLVVQEVDLGSLLTWFGGG